MSIVNTGKTENNKGKEIDLWINMYADPAVMYMILKLEILTVV